MCSYFWFLLLYCLRFVTSLSNFLECRTISCLLTLMFRIHLYPTLLPYLMVSIVSTHSTIMYLARYCHIFRLRFHRINEVLLQPILPNCNRYLIINSVVLLLFSIHLVPFYCYNNIYAFYFYISYFNKAFVAFYHIICG